MTDASAGWSGAGEDRGAGRWRVIHAVAAFGAGVLASLIAAAAVWSGGVSVFETFAVVGTAQTLVTIGVVALLRRAPGRAPLNLHPAPADALGLLIGAGLAIGVSFVTYAVLQLVGVEVPEQSVAQIADEAVGIATQAAVVITAVLLAPLAEELVFRGVLLRALQDRFSARVSGLISAAAFALVHLALDPMAWAAVPALFVAGLVLAALVQHSGRLALAVITHAGFNLVGVVMLLVA